MILCGLAPTERSTAEVLVADTANVFGLKSAAYCGTAGIRNVTSAICQCLIRKSQVAHFPKQQLDEDHFVQQGYGND